MLVEMLRDNLGFMLREASIVTVVTVITERATRVVR